MQLRLPEDKLQKYWAAVHNTTGRRSTTLKNLQLLNGLLNFAYKVVVPGRAFLRRLINFTIGVTTPHHHIVLNQAAWVDVAAWDVFLSHFNGKALVCYPQRGKPLIHYTVTSRYWYIDSVAAAEFASVFQIRRTGFMGNSPHPGSVRISRYLTCARQLLLCQTSNE